MIKSTNKILLIIFLLSPASSLLSQFDYSEFDQLLQKYVVEKRVLYSQLLEEKEKLFRFTNLLAQVSPISDPEMFKDNNEKLAYWINAYNAFILKIIIEHYPIKSIKDINFVGFTVWLTKNNIGGEDISFKSLEDDIIRGEFHDPRIHFALNCASISCPPLQDRAFLPDLLDDQLDESTKSFINDMNNVRINDERGVLYLSSIFDWYEDDFIDWLHENKELEDPHLLDYIKLYYDGQIIDEWYENDIEFLDYNWNLNDKL
jgi:hypothetical protein